MPTLDEIKPKFHVADIIYHGDKLILPLGLSFDEAIALIQRRKNYENEITEVNTTIDCFPYDGAYALYNVLKAKFGWVSMETIYSFFGDQRPQMIEIESGVGKVLSVPWGRLTLFKAEGFIDTGYARKGNRFIFSLHASVRRKYEPLVKEIYAEVRDEITAHSIYRGKAIAVRFRDDNANALPIPQATFVDTSDAHRENLIFSKDVQDSIDTNLFTPIERMDDCKAAGIPVKRGVLLAGKFGVGKTLAAKVAAGIAEKHHITFIYCKRTDEFAEAVELAIQYGPAVLFCEDIDRVITGDRTAAMDTILNIIDGIDTKSAEIIVVLTTNAPQNINPAVLRPGRLDAIVDVKEPDPDAVIRLIHSYGGTFIDTKADLQKIGMLLAGNIPAVIEEVVKRSKLSALKLTPRGSNIVVGEAALTEAATTMKMQLDLLNPQRSESNGNTDLTQALRPIFAAVVDEVAKKQIKPIVKSVLTDAGVI